MMKITSILFTIFYLSCSVKCAKILGVFPAPGYSQFILGERLMCELADRGHNVTLISPYKPKSCLEKCRTIFVEGLVDLVKGEDLFNTYKQNVFQATFLIHNLGYLLTEYTLANKYVQELINSEEIFDLVIIEKFVNEAHMAFAKHFNVPLVLLSSIGPSEWTHASVGNINLPSVVPVCHSPFTTTMNFFERLLSTGYSIFDSVYWHWVVLPQQQTFVNKYFPKPVYLKEILYNVSLILLNSDVSTTEPFSTVSNMVQIGGFHIETKELPENVQDFLDSATDGAIYFSMGSNLNSTNFPPDKLSSILNVIGKLKQKVVWKLEDNIIGKPKNLLVGKWLPQADILGHPKMHAFISHGGLLSVTEAVFHGVPIIGIPIFGDQHMNVARVVKHGIGINLPLEDINEVTFHNAIKEILENPKYQIEARKRSNILRDQIGRPIDRATFWVEYVLRHKGAYHLRAASVDLYWFQLYCLDVVFAVILVLVLVFVILMHSIKHFSVSKSQKRNKATNKKKQKKQ